MKIEIRKTRKAEPYSNPGSRNSLLGSRTPAQYGVFVDGIQKFVLNGRSTKFGGWYLIRCDEKGKVFGNVVMSADTLAIAKEKAIRFVEREAAWKFRAVRRVLHDEVESISIGQEMDSHFGYDPGPYYEPSRDALRWTMEKVGVTFSEVVEWLAKAQKVEEEKAGPSSHPGWCPTAYYEIGWLCEILDEEVA